MGSLNNTYTNAKPLDRSQIYDGDIVAFNTEYGRGVALMQNGNWFHSAYNLNRKNEVWVMDNMPENIQLFPPTEDDILLAIDHIEVENIPVEEEDSYVAVDFWSKYLNRGVYRIRQAVEDLNIMHAHVEERWQKELKRSDSYSNFLKKQIDELEAELKEKDKKIVQLETQLNEMSKLSAGVAKKSSQDDVLKAMRTYLNISKRKTLSKREAAKTVFMDLFTSTKLDLPDDIKEMLTYLDDEQAEPKVVNVAGNYNDIHDNKAVKMKE